VSESNAKDATASAIDAYIGATSALFQIADPERGAQWAQRLSMSLPDLASVGRAVCDHDAAPLGLPAAAANAAPSQAQRDALNMSDLAQGVVAGLNDPVARVEQCLAAIDAHRNLNAFNYVDRDGALRQATALCARRDAGQQLGPLAGAILAVKDCFEVAALPMSSGTRALPIKHPTASAPAVQRLQEADAIVIGMTNMHELAYGATSDNPHFGRVGHPMDASRIAGGSSGGSAVAVATGMADIALGTDSAGSVRMPAALCGLVGFKPSFGAVSNDGMLPLAWSLDHVGMLTTSVRDAASMFDLMAGLPFGVSLADPAAARPDEIRLFRPQNYFFDFIDPGVAAAFERALAQLEAAGFPIRHGVIEGLEIAPALQFTTLCAEASQIHLDRALAMPEGLGEEVRVRLESGQFIRAVDYIKAQRLRRCLLTSLSAPLESLADVMITPTVLTGACAPASVLEFNGKRVPIHMALTRCTLPFNLTGMPAISIPCGQDAQGFPVGLQIVGRVGQDAATLRAAAAIEAVLKA
jgi:Asp-tRNA(Asn)/Glu-tRNA(Gln) amidotransferase A subunit family amidase